MDKYQYQILLVGNISEHALDLKGNLERLMKTMGMDMDTLVCFPSSIKDVRPEMPALVVYFASFQTDDDAWLEDAKKMHIPVLPVFDTRTSVEPQLSQSFDLFQFFRLTKADDYAELAKQILTSLQLSERKKAFLIYQPSEPNPLRMELFDELVRRGYSVTMDAYKELPDEEQMKRLAESEILIFFYDREILKKQGMREMLAIRDVIRALATVLLPHVTVVWGGDPALFPIVCSVCKNREIKEKCIVLYQPDTLAGEWSDAGKFNNEAVEVKGVSPLHCCLSFGS